MACAWTSLGKLTLKFSLAYASTFNYSQSVVLVEKRCLVSFLLLTVTVASKLFPFCVESAMSKTYLSDTLLINAHFIHQMEQCLLVDSVVTEKFLGIACMSIECYESVFYFFVTDS
ncbi:hypothetical protein C8R48DRAFT_75156 [Suillus tomentosus]|nr:hypothetical protein C8R48DRAFT_75156 [Suillus tomentosus]